MGAAPCEDGQTPDGQRGDGAYSKTRPSCDPEPGVGCGPGDHEDAEEHHATLGKVEYSGALEDGGEAERDERVDRT